jgi:Txe/YoeB family toxin of Txe-Axe toxin-antitoxin module
MMPVREMMRPWLRKNLTRWTIDNAALGQEAWKTNQNPETLIVINYGYLDVVHEYLPLQMAEYDRWMNREKTLWTKVNEITNHSSRQQFVVYKMPSVLQGRTVLDKYSTGEVSIQMTDVKMVDEHEEDEFVAIVNYSIIGLIQLEKGFSENLDEDRTEILKLYDDYAQKAKDLMLRKNHDYGEAWREMRISSITDLIYQKVLRTKQIEDNQGKTLVSEGLDANYYDMLNYAVFCLIKMMEEKK